MTATNRDPSRSRARSSVAGNLANLVHLDPDHPGFRDPAYRERRDRIARLALEYVPGDVLPDVAYTEEEHRVWRHVRQKLAPLHRRRACKEYLVALELVALDHARIPQLTEVNRALVGQGGFRMEPVAGLIAADKFLRRLGDGVFLSTQYIRHHSRPLYTPEPDVVHELVGHAATLAHPDFAALSRAFGKAAQRSEERELLLALERLYWFTLEFGVALEDGEPKAYGAGLLSSFGELGRFDQAELLDFDLDRAARTPYDPTDYQATLFVAPSFQAVVAEVLDWLERPSRRP